MMYDFAEKTVSQALAGVPREDLPYMQTYTGVKWVHMAPRIEDVRLEDIAQGLSQICRFAGQIKTFYSVAQHVVLCSYYAPEEFKFDALHHDDGEAYCVDLPRPIKRAPGMEIYRYYEDIGNKVIQEYFGLGPEPKEVKEVDTRMLVTEARDLFNEPCKWEGYKDIEPYKEAIVPWTPEQAKERYLNRHYILGGK